MTDFTFLPSHTFTVSELNESIKTLLERNFGFISVEGEVSNVRIPSSGHCYFTLKDNKSQLKAVLFKGQKALVPFKIEEGQKIICLGRLALYSPRGEYQIIAERVEPSGLGSLHLAFEQLKIKLESEGLFDEREKRAIPPHPGRIGIVTSPTGAAIRDILKILKRRKVSVDILISPAMVQGEGAPKEIAKAIGLLNEEKGIDVIIVSRGGGSIEDLWAFNEEAVARAIYHSRIPVISAIGHERDVTIADFVADMRVSTPSAAAEIVAKCGDDLFQEIIGLEKRLLLATKSKEAIMRGRLKLLQKGLKDPKKTVTDLRLRVDELIFEK